MKKLSICLGYLLGLGLCLYVRPAYAQSADSIYLLLQEFYMEDTMQRSKTKIEQPDSNKILHTLPNPSFIQPFVKPGNGLLSLQYMHQSFVDTPFSGGSISSQQLMYQQNFSMLNFFPVGVTVWGRASNSPYYRNLLDVQVSYNKQHFLNENREKVAAMYMAGVENRYYGQLHQLLDKNKFNLNRLQNISSKQQMHQWKLQLKELLSVKEKSFDLNLPDSINENKFDSIQKRAGRLLDLINYYEQKMAAYESTIDSLEQSIMAARTKVNTIKQRSNRLSLFELLKEMKTSEFENKLIKQDKYAGWMRFLSGIQQFSIGRAPLDAGELTARNVSLNGLQFTYNSWYIVSAAVGRLDFRFRDLDYSSKKRNWNPYWSAKVGLGKLTGHYLAVSYFSGQKQIGSQYNQGSSIKISGAAIEAQTRLHKYGFIKAELAQSNAPDFRSHQIPDNTKIGRFRDANTAAAIRMNMNFHRIGMRMDGLYRKSGSNFQSFSTWQMNTAQEQWYIKLDQTLLRNKLRLSGSLRKQDFSNPYLTQHFRTNTVFKTISASLRIPGWPFLTVGYIPVSQYAMVAQQVIETRFQTLSAQIFHHYRIGRIMTVSQFLFNKNLNRDQQAFLYNDTRTIMFNQTFLFKVFSSTMSVSDTRNTVYQLTILDNKLHFPLFKNVVQVGGGVKLGRYNTNLYKIGGSSAVTIQLKSGDQLQLQWDKSFIPTESRGLMYNDMANILFVKTINFSTKFKNVKNAL